MITMYNKTQRGNALATCLLKEAKLLVSKIPEIENEILRSDERTYPGIYEKLSRELKESLAEASAFDERTLQDIKYHEKATEYYIVLQGSLRIIWKDKTRQEWQDEQVVTQGELIEIPYNHCLAVKSGSDSFLAVALKTHISKRVTEPEKKDRDPGKIQGTFCIEEECMNCKERAECEFKQKIREYYFSLLARVGNKTETDIMKRINNREKALFRIRRLF